MLEPRNATSEVGNKVGKLLAWLDKKERAARWVPDIAYMDGVEVRSTESTTELFATYYTQIYTSVTTTSALDSKKFLADIWLATLSAADIEMLESELTADAIYDIQSGNAMGPNGVPKELYKIVATELGGILPRDQRLVNIIVIHKDGKPQEDCVGYRPISLLNAEVKSLAKVLATRLKRYHQPDPRGSIRFHAQVEYSAKS